MAFNIYLENNKAKSLWTPEGAEDSSGFNLLSYLNIIAFMSIKVTFNIYLENYKGKTPQTPEGAEDSSS